MDKIKTIDGWREAAEASKDKYAFDWDDYCKYGDKVAEDVIEHFRNVMPPVCDWSSLFQMGSPYDHIQDPVDGKTKATFLTFAKEGGDWVYKGNCFAHESEPLEVRPLVKRLTIAQLESAVHMYEIGLVPVGGLPVEWYKEEMDRRHGKDVGEKKMDVNMNKFDGGNMTLEQIKGLLDKAHVVYDMAGDTIRAYVSKESNDFDTIRVGPDGGVVINGRIGSLQRYLGLDEKKEMDVKDVDVPTVKVSEMGYFDLEEFFMKNGCDKAQAMVFANALEMPFTERDGDVFDDLVEFWHTHDTGDELHEFMRVSREDWGKYTRAEIALVYKDNGKAPLEGLVAEAVEKKSQLSLAEKHPKVCGKAHQR